MTVAARLAGDGDRARRAGGDGWRRVASAVRRPVSWPRHVDDGVVGPPRWEAPSTSSPPSSCWDGGLVWAAGQRARAARSTTTTGRRSAAAASPRSTRPTGGWSSADASSTTSRGATAASPWRSSPARLCGFGRRGEVHVFDARDGTLVATSAPLADSSLGHRARRGRRRHVALWLQSRRLPAAHGVACRPSVGLRSR